MIPSITLNNGVEMPSIGYRAIDTATLYRNERGVGAAVRSSGLPREELFVTTKVWNTDHGYDRALRAFDTSLAKLGLDHVDLYLIHWPVAQQDRYVDTWRALEKIRADGRARAIGVSNFQVPQLRRLLDETDVVPAVNQIELHPLLPQAELREFGAAHGIVTESWSPLARGRLLGNGILTGIARKHGKTAAQVVLRWHVQLGLVAIPKSVSAARIAENIDIFDFELDSADLDAIATLGA
jgi:diketogulonate reductase-like aldo/keto reductase